MKNNIIRTAVLSLSLSAVTLFSGQALASNCKGLENDACVASKSCSWVAGYERKDGRQVKAFCRAKPGAKTDLATTSKATKRVAKNVSQ